MIYAIIAIVVLLLGGLAAMLVKTVPIAKRVYNEQLVRTSPDKWGRVCSDTTNEEQVAMFEAGCRWAEAHKDAMREVDIVNEGFHLYGEYYDFGAKRCALILPGRCESLKYSYYFAAPYEKAGLNVLVIDTRCHGHSDGKYNTIGVQERSDVKAWARYLNKQLGMEEVYLHGICIGSASGLFAMADRDCPACVKGMTTEGCFTNFRETFKRHMIADHRPLFPVLDLVMLEIFLHTGTRVLSQSPIRTMPRIRQRMLFLFGELDVFSVPPKSRELFEACGSADKHIVWYPKGAHSHLRINNTEAYDRAVADFVNGKLQ